MIDVADIKYKAIILIYISTGKRRSAIPWLKLADIKKMGTNSNDNDSKEIYMFRIYSRTTEQHYTFCTPECFNAISTYLDYRKRCGEQLLPESPLFRKDFDERMSVDVTNAKPISSNTIADKIRAISIAAGVTVPVPLSEGNPTGRRRNQASLIHGFRRFAITNMAKSRNIDPT